MFKYVRFGFCAAGLVLALNAAAVVAQPYNESFDNVPNIYANDWVHINHSATIGVQDPWYQGIDVAGGGPFDSQSGATNSYIAANYNSTTGTNTISAWLLTPTRTLSNGDTLTFYTRCPTNDPFPDRLQVRMSLAGNGTDVGVGATGVGTFTNLLLDINPTYTVGGYPGAWTQFSITLAGIGAPTSGRLAFRYFVENGGPSGANSDYIGIDTVSYTPEPASIALLGLAGLALIRRRR